MTERGDRLEAELSAMTPRAVPSDLINRIEARIAAGEARPWGDRCLLSAMCSGALAACVIVGVLAMQPAGSSSSPLGPTELAAPRLGDGHRLLSRAEGHLLETWSRPLGDLR